MIDEMRYDVFSDEHFPDDDDYRFHWQLLEFF